MVQEPLAARFGTWISIEQIVRDDRDQESSSYAPQLYGVLSCEAVLPISTRCPAFEPISYPISRAALSNGS